MRFALLAPFVFAAGLFASEVALADTMAYPSADKASFVIDYPSDWEMTPGENVGDYTTLTGPTGAVLSFRTIPGTEEALLGAIQESKDWFAEHYTDVKIGDAKDAEQHGLKGFYATGSGTDPDAGPVGFVMGWYELKDGTIGEIWFAVTAGDEAGSKAAGDILESFRAP